MPDATVRSRPNILLFLTDDHGAWATGCYGNSEVRSPILDELARCGARFANAFTPSPVCSPARACLLTGRTPSQVGIHDYLAEILPEVGPHDWLAEETTLPQLLSSHGYHCGLSGKWHLGQSNKTPRGFDWCFGLPGAQGDHLGTYTYHLNGHPLTLTGNKTHLITDYALKFLAESSGETPFFLNVGYIGTHSPYGDQEPDLIDSYAAATFRDIPPYVPHPWRHNEGFPQDANVPIADIRQRQRGYYAAVTDIDRNVGRILRVLAEQGRLDNTLVIYTADHGCALGHHGFWGKGNSTRPLNMYETSLRIPLIMQWPGHIQAGIRIDRCVDHYDTFQTLCQAAGIQTPEGRNYPGLSYWPLLHGESMNWDDTRYGEYGDLRMIRTPHWKFVKRYPDGPDDLFDLQADAGETVNLAGSPSHQTIQSELTERLNRFYERFSDPAKSGLRVKQLRRHNSREAWRDGVREVNCPTR